MSQEKRRLYKAWSKSRTVEDQEAYRQSKVSAMRVIFKAQEAERKKFGELLDEEEEKGHVFRLADGEEKQRCCGWRVCER